MEMTQGFLVVGKNPGLFVLGEPTHDREDLDEKHRALPDHTNFKAYIIPAGFGLILKKGTWHDFPVSCGPPVSCFIMNTEEVVEALASMPCAAPMNHGDCFKLRLSDHWDFKLKFPDPRPFVQKHGLVPGPVAQPLMGPEGYGAGMRREEVSAGWAGDSRVIVIPVVNVEVFMPGCGGPGIQPHLQSVPEVANRGWRDYVNLSGLQRLSSMFKKLGFSATAVINSEAAAMSPVAKALKESGWELGAHGINNSSGNAKMNRKEEEDVFNKCIGDLEASLGERPGTWLTPQFSITERTPEIAAASGLKVLMDFVDDDVPYDIVHAESGNRILCLPYCMETNDFSLVLTKMHDPRQYAQAIEDHVRQLATESGEKVVCLGMHTFVAGTPGRVLALSEALGRLKSCPGVTFATASQVHAMIRKK
jgi:peptidoglycan/xylan/chitin deacetylase (PgdA/CDA1 family)